jgi:hypothetical protein
MDQWVKTYKVASTLDGVNWAWVDGGRTFSGNTDRNSHIQNKFRKTVSARALRIHPVSWNNHISLRFDATYLA